MDAYLMDLPADDFLLCLLLNLTCQHPPLASCATLKDECQKIAFWKLYAESLSHFYEGEFIESVCVCVCGINFFFCSMKCDSLYWKGLILLSYSTRIWRNMYINKQRKNYRLTYDLKYLGCYYSYCYVGTVWETMLRQSTYSKEINGFDWLPWCPTEADLGRRRGGKKPWGCEPHIQALKR